jgi:hypothetical protein
MTSELHPNQPLVKSINGVLRFKPNAIVDYLLTTHHSCSLNELATLDFSNEDRQQFAQLIGYSVSGWGGLPYVSEEAKASVELMQNSSFTL